MPHYLLHNYSKDKSLDQDNCLNQAFATAEYVADRYTMTLKEETFLIYGYGIGDTDCMLIFRTQKMLSLLQESQSLSFQSCCSTICSVLYFHAEKENIIIPCIYALLTIKTEFMYRKLLSKLLELCLL